MASDGRDPAFGERLRLLRTAKGLTQQELAVAASVSKGSIEGYERGRLPRTALPRLAEALGVTPYFLLHGSETLEIEVGLLLQRMDRLELRLGQLEQVLTRAAEAQRRIWLSLDATLRLLLSQVASREILAQLDEPLDAGRGLDAGEDRENDPP